MIVKVGLIVYGCGEVFDYLIGERMIELVERVMRVVVVKFFLVEYLVILVNGNVVVFVLKEMIELVKVFNVKFEINFFYCMEERVRIIVEEFRKYDLEIEIFGINLMKRIFGFEYECGKVDENGIWKVDVVFVLFEDGDRMEVFVRMGKFVVIVDLNFFLWSVRMVDIMIVDNIVRVYLRMVEFVREMKDYSREEFFKIVGEYDNGKIFSDVLFYIRDRLMRLVEEGIWRRKEFE